MTHAKKELSKIILRKLKNFLDKLLGDYADELYWKYIHLLRKDYLKIFQNNEQQPHRQILINKILKNNNIKKVLELGCGDGVNLRILAKYRSINLYGIDINKRAIQLGIKKINNFNFNIKLICSKI